MKHLFVFQTTKGFGKGWNLNDAVNEYRRYNGMIRKSDKISLLIFDAKSMDDVSIDGLSWQTKNFAKFLFHG